MHAEFWRIQGASWSLCKHFLPHILVTFRQWHLSKLQTLLLQYSRLIAFRKTGDHPCNTMWISCHNTGIFFFFFTCVQSMHAQGLWHLSPTISSFFSLSDLVLISLSLSVCFSLAGVLMLENSICTWKNKTEYYLSPGGQPFCAILKFSINHITVLTFETSGAIGIIAQWLMLIWLLI